MREAVSGFRVREAVEDDLAGLLALEQSVESAPHWSEALWRQALEASSMEAASRSAALQRMVLVAGDVGVVAGFIAIQLVSGIAEIESLAVSPQRRRCGVARALCSAGLDWARSQRAQAMELEVRASNAAAIGLYLSLGFREQGRRRGYYRDPVEDAVLMSRDLQDE